MMICLTWWFNDYEHDDSMMKNKRIVCECLGLPNSETNPTDLGTSATWANMINTQVEIYRVAESHITWEIYEKKHSFNCLESQRVQMIKVLVLVLRQRIMNNEWWILSSIYFLTAFLAPSYGSYAVGPESSAPFPSLTVLPSWLRGQKLDISSNLPLVSPGKQTIPYLVRWSSNVRQGSPWWCIMFLP